MPFKSQAQMRAAFGGYLGPEMQQRADTWAHETPNLKRLPMHVGTPRPLHSAFHRQAILGQMKAQ